MPLLYKYLRPEDDNDPVPHALRTQTLLASDPRTFNDPFEVRPWFDQERQNYFASGHEGFYETVLGHSHSLINQGSMVDIPPERASCFGEKLNRKFREELGKRFRVLCLSTNPKNVLLWGHYTRSYRGVVVGLDVAELGFPTGLRPEGFKIEYTSDRSKTKLPLAYYQFPPVEHMGMNGQIVNSPNEEVISDGGLLIPFSHYQQQLEEARIRALTIKAESWAYEEEVRFIYELPTHNEQICSRNGLSLVEIPPGAIREIIIGFNASIAMVEGIVNLYESGALGKPKLHYTTCHPNLFEVQKHEADARSLLDYFRVILPYS